MFSRQNHALESLHIALSPPVTTHLVMNMHTPPSDLMLHPCLAPFQDKPSSHKTLFHKHFCTPRHTTLVASLEQNLCMLPQVPCFGKSCLTLGTRIVLRHFVEIFDQESVIFVNADVDLRHPNLSKGEGKYFHEKVPSSSFSYPAIPCWKWFSIKEKWPL